MQAHGNSPQHSTHFLNQRRSPPGELNGQTPGARKHAQFFAPAAAFIRISRMHDFWRNWNMTMDATCTRCFGLV